MKYYNEDDIFHYLAVVRSGKNYVDAIEYMDGELYRLTKIHFEGLCIHMPLMCGMEPRELTHKTLNYRQYVDAGNPKIYIGRIGSGSRNTRVVLGNYNELIIPNDELESWRFIRDLDELSSCRYKDWLRYADGRKLEDLTFGIEFEFLGLVNRGARASFDQAMKELLGDAYAPEESAGPKYWTLGDDSSIRTRSGYYGYELQTPILHHTDADYQTLGKVLQLIQQHLKGEVNDSCGTHIHIGNFLECSDAYNTIHYHEDQSIWENYMERLKGLSLCYGSLERTVFDQLVVRSRRHNNNEYCESCQKYNDERHRKINLQCFEDNGTIENRHHHGTLDLDDIWHWMELIGRFVLKYFENTKSFESVRDIPSFFETIGLDSETRGYYLTLFEQMRAENRLQIERLMQYADFRSADDREREPADTICLRQLKEHDVSACA